MIRNLMRIKSAYYLIKLNIDIIDEIKSKDSFLKSSSSSSSSSDGTKRSFSSKKLATLLLIAAPRNRPGNTAQNTNTMPNGVWCGFGFNAPLRKCVPWVIYANFERFPKVWPITPRAVSNGRIRREITIIPFYVSSVKK
ncbi:unnamed protein product [Ceratitis capitata]|uniref:(Mediterranean fruit fly) hypothetical protein n=1 Tax=Ceratitis capitata TaxID=7213 RepID=A0A811VC82_CERCA|nr:unnamed protein product [Ceratitis capitata]